MPSTIEGPGYNFVASTRRLTMLLDFALHVGRAAAVDDTQQGFVSSLWQWRQSIAPNAPFKLEERFPTGPQQKFWAAVFRNVARRIFLREIGDQSETYWQARAITDAVTIGRLLAECVRGKEPDWVLETEDDQQEALAEAKKLVQAGEKKQAGPSSPVAEARTDCAAHEGVLAAFKSKST